MNAYRVTGNFKMGERWMPFTMEVMAENADGAKDGVFSLLGSRHRVKRGKIEVGEVEAISPEEATSPVVRFHTGGRR